MGRGKRFSFAPALGRPRAGGSEGQAAGAETTGAAPSAPDLEAGVAAILAGLRDGTATAPQGEGSAAADNGVTFDLLGELDRLWRNRAA